MATIKRFEEIEVWKLAAGLCTRIGKMIDEGRFKKNFRLIDQLEGSTGSIMDNIAEGFERGTKGEFVLFLGYAKGSSGELRSQLYRARDRGYINNDEFKELNLISENISGKIQKFIEYLKKSNLEGVRKK